MTTKSMILWLAVGYWVVTMVGIGHTTVNWLVLGMDGHDASQGMYGIESYAKTVPWHPLYNIILWPLFAYFCLRRVPRESRMRASIKLGAIWAVATIVIDLIGWVLVPHVWAMTFKELYLDYQPWITFIYLAIFVAPPLAAWVMSRRETSPADEVAASQDAPAQVEASA